MSEEEKLRVLVVDDEAANLALVNDALKGAYHVSACKTFSKALNLLENYHYAAIITDFDLQDNDGDGLGIIEAARQSRLNKDVPVIVMSGSTEKKKDALDAGAALFLGKPVDPRTLKDIVESCSHKLQGMAVKPDNTVIVASPLDQTRHIW